MSGSTANRVECPTCHFQAHPLALACPHCQTPLINKSDAVASHPPSRASYFWQFHPRKRARALVPYTGRLKAAIISGQTFGFFLMADAIEPIIGEKGRFPDMQTIGSMAVKSFLVGIAVGIVIPFLLSFLLKWVGSKLDTHLTAVQFQALVASSLLPLQIWTLALLSEWLVYYPDYFETNQFLQYVPGDFGLWWDSSGIFLLGVICFFWMAGLFVIGLSELSGTLIWTALAVFIITGLIIGAILFIIAYINLITLLHRF